MPAEPAASVLRRLLARVLRQLVLVDRRETAAVLIGFVYFFLVFMSYALLRPLRETMGITGGVENLKWLFTVTFLTMLAAMPLFGLVSAKFRRIALVPWVNAFFMLNLLVFAILFYTRPENVWVARVFYVWLSVFVLFVVSVAWSVMVDAFRPDQAKRLFALMAGGISTGGLVGAWTTTLLVQIIGHWGLVSLSTLLLGSTIPCVRYLFRWRSEAGSASDPSSLAARENPQRAIGGNPFAGLTLILKSPYLLGIAAFVLLLTAANTFLYFDQARLVEAAYPDKEAQTRVFGTIDGIVNSLALGIQLLLTGHVASRLGLAVLLTSVPLIVMGGFIALSFAPVFGVLAVVMVIRRVGEYAMLRPGREMLFSVVDVETKYKAKNFIDTVVYRGGDFVTAWLKAGLDALGQGMGFVALIGAALAAVWAAVGFGLGRMHESRIRARATPVPSVTG
jgi:ATP:ADP antiporter, AAA family